MSQSLLTQSKSQQKAVNEWVQILGEQNVVIKNTVMEEIKRILISSPKKILGLLKPYATHQIQEVIKIAIIHKTPLYVLNQDNEQTMHLGRESTESSFILDLSSIHTNKQEKSEKNYQLIKIQLFEELFAI